MYLMNKKFNKWLLVIYVMISLFFWNTDFLKSDLKFVPRVYYNFFNYPIKGDFSKTGLRIFLQIPYNDMTFLKNEDYFTSTFEVNIIIWDGDNLILDKSFEESFSVVEFEETNSDSIYFLWEYSFEIEPKKYEIEMIFTDKNSDNISKGKVPLEIKEFNKDAINISDMLFLNRIEFLPDNVVKLFPVPANNVGIGEKDFYVYFEMFVPDEKKELTIKYNILDELREDNKVVKSGSISAENNKKYDYFYTDLLDLELEMGRYLIAYQIEQDGNSDKVTASFSVGWEGLPESIKDFDKAVDQMKYIASRKEMKKIKEKEGYEKLEAFKEFWDKKDPSPGVNGNEKMIEYYRRINFAIKRFSSSRRATGWMTDRGYIYVIMGEPDEIYSQPFESSNMPPYNKPYEIWYYYQKKRSYTFIDETGFGDFILVSPIYYEDSDMLN